MSKPAGSLRHKDARAALPPAVLLSALVHALVVLIARPAMLRSREAAEPESAVDVWTGTTADPSAHSGMYEIAVDGVADPGGARGASSPPESFGTAAFPVAAAAEPGTAAPRPAPAPEAAKSPSSHAAPAPDGATAEPRPTRPRVPKVPAPEKHAPATRAAEKAKQKPAPPEGDGEASGAGGSEAGAATLPVAATHRSKRGSTGKAAASASAAAGSGAPSAGASGGEFGAEGEAAAMRDLGRAFTRAIPPGSDADPIWSSLPAGDGGRIEIAIDVDEEGHITGWHPTREHAAVPAHLASLVKRTLALLAHGTFALRGEVGAGTEVLVLSARITDGDAEPGAGGVFGLRYGYARGHGTASFQHANGRSVDVTVDLVRLEGAAAKK